MQTLFFIVDNNERILSKRIHRYSAYFDGCSRGISWPVRKSLDLFLPSQIRQTYFSCWTLQNKAFRLIRVYVPNISTELPDLFQQIELFLIISRWVILAGDLSAVLDFDIDHTRERSGRETVSLLHRKV